MSARMDLVAGDARDILVALSADDQDALDDPARFAAHLALGGGLDPTWLDLFAEATRAVTGGDGPPDFLDARIELDDEVDPVAGTVERVDPTWVSTVALVADHDLGAIAGRWIDLIEDDLGQLPRDEKPWIRDLAGRIVSFCRAADRAPDVLFVWSLG